MKILKLLQEVKNLEPKFIIRAERHSKEEIIKTNKEIGTLNRHFKQVTVCSIKMTISKGEGVFQIKMWIYFPTFINKILHS